jgi:hypothetical protein
MSTIFKSNKITKHLAKVGRVIRPLGENTARIMLIAIFSLVLILEVNQLWDGVISALGSWIWDRVLVYKSVTFGLGMLLCYLIMRYRRVKSDTTVCNSVFKTAPLCLDLDALEKHAEGMGVKLHLKDDPRIAARNTPAEDAPPKPGAKK